MLPYFLKKDITLTGYKVISTIQTGAIGGGIHIDKIDSEKRPFDLKENIPIFFATYKTENGEYKTGFIANNYFFPYSDLGNIVKKTTNEAKGLGDSNEKTPKEYIVLQNIIVKGYNEVPKGSKSLTFPLTKEIKKGFTISGGDIKEKNKKIIVDGSVVDTELPIKFLRFKTLGGKRNDGTEFKGKAIYDIPMSAVKEKDDTEKDKPQNKSEKDTSKTLNMLFSKRNVITGSFIVLFNLVAYSILKKIN